MSCPLVPAVGRPRGRSPPGAVGPGGWRETSYTRSPGKPGVVVTERKAITASGYRRSHTAQTTFVKELVASMAHLPHVDVSRTIARNCPPGYGRNIIAASMTVGESRTARRERLPASGRRQSRDFAPAGFGFSAGKAVARKPKLLFGPL